MTDMLKEIRESIVGPEWIARIRADYPEATDGMEDDWIIDRYAAGWKYADTWDHIGDARRDYQRLADAYLAQDAELTTLRAKLDAAERDAARYRWLRANAVNGRMESGGPNPDFALNCDEPESEWDAAIDATANQGEG